jgi:microcystin-dependent protein
MSESTFTWGTVTALGPLRVKLDGDSAAVPVTPDSLVDPTVLAVSSRVRCEITNNRLVVLGVAGGEPNATAADLVAGTNASRAVTSAALAALFPVGFMLPSALAAVPAGWLLCDGSAVSRTTYALLFAAISTQFGVGNGSTTFNVPNIKGRTIVGQDTGQTEFDVRGETGGAKTHTLALAEVPGALVFQGFGGGNLGTAGDYNRLSNAGSGNGAHNNLQPYIALNYLIRAA